MSTTRRQKKSPSPVEAAQAEGARNVAARPAAKEHPPEVTSSKAVWAGRWLEMHEARYRDREGKSRRWSYVERRGAVAAVAVVAMRAGKAGPEFVLIRQFRPPVGHWVWELPAGLVDPGESPEVAALRELREETGCQGEVVAVGPTVLSSPGLTTETIRVVEVRVTGVGKARPEGSEAIEVHSVAQSRLREHLVTVHAAGDGIDAKLWMLASQGAGLVG